VPFDAWHLLARSRHGFGVVGEQSRAESQGPAGVVPGTCRLVHGTSRHVPGTVSVDAAVSVEILGQALARREPRGEDRGEIGRIDRTVEINVARARRLEDRHAEVRDLEAELTLVFGVAALDRPADIVEAARGADVRQRDVDLEEGRARRGRGRKPDSGESRRVERTKLFAVYRGPPRHCHMTNN